jgi:hypothetical protein
MFYLRINPSLFKEKADTEKQFKNYSEETSLEWRQYCLDSLFTNYNQTIQNISLNIYNTNNLANYLTNSSGGNLNNSFKSQSNSSSSHSNNTNTNSSLNSSSNNSSTVLNNSSSSGNFMSFLSILSIPNIISMINNSTLLPKTPSSASFNTSSSVSAISAPVVDYSNLISTTPLSPSYINSKYQFN